MVYVVLSEFSLRCAFERMHPHVVRMVESHICTNRPRVHLERVHPPRESLAITSDGEVLLHG